MQEKTTEEKIEEIGKNIVELLQYKNKQYGDSWKCENNVFYSGTAQSSILIRLDDKLNRIRKSKANENLRTNDIVDIIGYLYLLLIAQNTSSEDITMLYD